MNTDTINFLGALITLAVLAFPLIDSLAQGIAQHFHNRTPFALDTTFKTTAQQVVSAAEQLSTVATDAGGIAPDQRKGYAVTAMQTILAHFGIKVGTDVLSTYIEDAVRLLPSSGFNSSATPFASGGVVASPALTMVAEPGPELMTPIPPPASAGDTPTLTVAITPAGDAGSAV